MVKFQATISVVVNDSFDSYCVKECKDKSRLVDKILRDFLESNGMKLKKGDD